MVLNARLPLCSMSPVCPRRRSKGQPPEFGAPSNPCVGHCCQVAVGPLLHAQASWGCPTGREPLHPGRECSCPHPGRATGSSHGFLSCPQGEAPIPWRSEEAHYRGLCEAEVSSDQVNFVSHSCLPRVLVWLRKPFPTWMLMLEGWSLWGECGRGCVSGGGIGIPEHYWGKGHAWAEGKVRGVLQPARPSAPAQQAVGEYPLLPVPAGREPGPSDFLARAHPILGPGGTGAHSQGGAGTCPRRQMVGSA